MGGPAVAGLVLGAALAAPQLPPCAALVAENLDLVGPVKEVVWEQTPAAGGPTTRRILRLSPEGFVLADLVPPRAPRWDSHFRFASPYVPRLIWWPVRRIVQKAPNFWVFYPDQLPPEYQEPFPPQLQSAPLPPVTVGGIPGGQPLPPGAHVIGPGKGSTEEGEERLEVEWKPATRTLVRRQYDLVGLVGTYEYVFDDRCQLRFFRELTDAGYLKLAEWFFYDSRGCLRAEVSWEPWRAAREGSWTTGLWLFASVGLPLWATHWTSPGGQATFNFAIDEVVLDDLGNWTARRVQECEASGTGESCTETLLERRQITYYDWPPSPNPPARPTVRPAGVSGPERP